MFFLVVGQCSFSVVLSVSHCLSVRQNYPSRQNSVKLNAFGKLQFCGQELWTKKSFESAAFLIKQDTKAVVYFVPKILVYPTVLVAQVMSKCQVQHCVKFQRYSDKKSF